MLWSILGYGIVDMVESKKKKGYCSKGHSNFGKTGRLNPRVRCRDLEQPCAGSDCESQERYKVHFQEWL